MDKQIIDIREKNEFTRCQKCKSKLIGRAVPRCDKRYFGKYTHYSLLIGLKQDPVVNVVSHWECPKCGFTFPRFS